MSPNGVESAMYIIIETVKSETNAEVLRSILSQMEFSHQVQEYSDKLGVQFCFHLYVPELHPVLKEPFCEHEDEVHLLKVCSNFAQVNLIVHFVLFSGTAHRSLHSYGGTSRNTTRMVLTWRHCMTLMLITPTQL